MNKSKYIPGSELPPGCYWKCKECGADVNEFCRKIKKETLKKNDGEIPLNKCEYTDKHVLYVRASEPVTNKNKKHKIVATEKHLIDLEAANFRVLIKQEGQDKSVSAGLDRILHQLLESCGIKSIPEYEKKLNVVKNDILEVYKKLPNIMLDSQKGINTSLPVTSSFNLNDLIKEYIDFHSHDIGLSILQPKRNIGKGQKKAVIGTLERLKTHITEYGKDINTFTILDFDDNILHYIQKELSEHYAESSFDKILQDLIAFENWIDDRKFHKKIPIKIFKLIPKKIPEPPQPNTLNSEEYLDIINTEGRDKEMSLCLDIAMETGFRQSNVIGLKYSDIIETVDSKPGVIILPDNKNNRRLNKTGKQRKFRKLPCTKRLQNILLNEFDYSNQKGRNQYIIAPELNKDEIIREEELIKKFKKEFNFRAKSVEIKRHITMKIFRKTVNTQYRIFERKYGRRNEKIFHDNPKNDEMYEADIKTYMIYAGWELFPIEI